MSSILVIGGGSIGKRHLRNLLALRQQDIAMVEPATDRAKENEVEFNVKVYNSLGSAYKEKKWDICFICSPTSYHAEQAWQAATAGSHLFIEKPLSHSLDGLDKLQKVVKQKKLVTLVGSNWKFYPSFKKIKEVLDSGVLGKIYSARCQFGQYLPDWHPWEDYRQGYSANKKLGGGILLDSHEFDYLTWFLGDVDKVVCMAEKVSKLEVDVEDVAEAVLKFRSGAIGEIHLDYLQRFYQRNFEFFGEHGTIIWDLNTKTVIVKTNKVGKNQDQATIEEFTLDDRYDINEMYVEEIKHFLEQVNSGGETITPLEHGIQVIKLIDAAKESAAKEKFITL